MRVAVAGGTGVVGRHVVVALRDAGHVPVVLTRSVGIDLATGRGLDVALDGVQAVVDVSGVQTLRRSTAVSFFQRATRNLLEAGLAAGVNHHVLLSIVGIDDVGSGYYAAKLGQEQLAMEGPLPCSVLRSTQFHEFVEQVLARGRLGPLRLVPAMRVQPVAAAEVAAALAELASVPYAVGRAPDLAGPQVHELTDVARRLLQTRERKGRVVGVRLPGELGRQLAGGGLLPGPGARHGTTTFDDWLSTAG